MIRVRKCMLEDHLVGRTTKTFGAMNVRRIDVSDV